VITNSDHIPMMCSKTHHVMVVPSSKYLAVPSCMYLVPEKPDNIHSMVVVVIEDAVAVEVWLRDASSFTVEVRTWAEGNARTHDVDSG
jgi:hypothetical protein